MQEFIIPLPQQCGCAVGIEIAAALFGQAWPRHRSPQSLDSKPIFGDMQ